MDDRNDGPMIMAEGLARTYGFGRKQVEALRGIDLEVRRGERFGLFGPDGAGKTTAMQILCGILPPTRGRVQVVGVDVIRNPDGLGCRISYMSEGFTLYGSPSVRENLDFCADLYRLPGSHDAFTTDGAKNVLKARAEVSIAEERYYMAQDLLCLLQTGSDSPTVTAAQRALDPAKGAVEQTNSAVSQAQANVDSIDKQIEKLTSVAPSDGVVLTRSVEPGAMAVPSATLLEIGRLGSLELTVYLPDEKFGLVKPGQAV
jgi:ABC-type Fe3+/spermidine/putrescine transport system ATPase subunit